jgi:Flp pilus assembly protein TadG
MVRPRHLAQFRREDDGATLVEFSIVMMMLFTVVLGFVDFGYALYQWNAASKAVQVGARLAAVSNPVASDLETFTGHDEGTTTPGGASLTYECVCDGADGVCGNGDTYTCPGDAVYSETAMDRIVFGSDGVCGAPVSADNPRRGMCDIYWRIAPENVSVDYVYSGLGFATRPEGPVPTIRVSLENLQFQFFFLGDLLGFGDMTLPSMASTITGEDLSRCWPRDLTPPDCT